MLPHRVCFPPILTPFQGKSIVRRRSRRAAPPSAGPLLVVLVVAASFWNTPVFGARCPDDDGDSYADCTIPGCNSSGLECGDCDDTNEDVNPGVLETCNRQDDNCDGAVDEGFERVLHQNRIYKSNWNEEEGFAYHLANISDVNDDGFDDFAIGAPWDGDLFTRGGSVELVSGADRSSICSAYWDAGDSYYYLGESVAGIGDVNGDDVPDFAAAAPDADLDGVLYAGAVVLFSGVDCSLIRVCSDPSAVYSDNLGENRRIAAGFDLTGDGVSEILAGNHSREVLVFDGASCAIHRRISDAGSSASLNGRIAFTEDLTGDGVPDILVGSPGNQDSGTVHVFSGADGSVYRVMVDPLGNWNDQLGASVASAPDLNGDGWPEVLAGAPWRDTVAGTDAGQIVVFSGATGAILYRAEDPDGSPEDALGRSVAALRDRDGDGVADFVAGAPLAETVFGINNGKAVVFSGVDGSRIRALVNAESRIGAGTLGYGLAEASDVNGDGPVSYTHLRAHET